MQELGSTSPGYTLPSDLKSHARTLRSVADSMHSWSFDPVYASPARAGVLIQFMTGR